MGHNETEVPYKILHISVSVFYYTWIRQHFCLCEQNISVHSNKKSRAILQNGLHHLVQIVLNIRVDKKWPVDFKRRKIFNTCISS